MNVQRIMVAVTRERLGAIIPLAYPRHLAVKTDKSAATTHRIRKIKTGRGCSFVLWTNEAASSVRD